MPSFSLLDGRGLIFRSQFIQSFRSEIRPIGPNDSTANRIQNCTGELAWLFEWFEHRTVKQWLNVYGFPGAVIKRQFE